ncbi:MAG TPA: FKBP-type peptidyl-prolyl cis-trans isomerase [Bacteroidales bacterium]|nr:FKBP-type peptidyl-prolyl cis-trans isomerase [Bacteroidales bacterium]
MKTAAGMAVLFLIALSGCNNSHGNGVNSQKPDTRDLARVNSYLVEKDRERIINYAERKNIALKETKSGLWYYIKNEGTGNCFRENDHVIMEYTCALLDGTPCYSSEKSGPKELVIGRSEMEAGMNEGLKLLKRGGEAVFVIPPFLAYGLLGDSKAIPPRATIVYEIKVKDK